MLGGSLLGLYGLIQGLHMRKDGKDDPFFEPLWKPKRPNGGASWAAWQTPAAPAPVYIPKEQWPSPKQRTDVVFAKSCVAENWCSTEAGTATEPASNFLVYPIP